MTSWQFCIVGIAGAFTLLLFSWLMFWRKEKFDPALLGLLTLSYLLIGISFLQPESIKYAGLEISTLTKDAKEANEKAKESVKLALETTAMLTWNAGHYDAAGKRNKEIATDILRELYGDKALDYRYALQRQGIFVTPEVELEKIPERPFPTDVQSPLYNRYLKTMKVDIN